MRDVKAEETPVQGYADAQRDTWPRDRFLEGVLYELQEKLVSLGQEVVVGGGTSPGEAACGVQSGR